MKTTKLAEKDRCPFCNYILNAATAGPHNPDASPEPNDATICINCGGVLIYDEHTRVRKPTDQELAEVMADPNATLMVQAVADLHRRRK